MKNKTIPQSLIAPLNAFLTSLNEAIKIDWKNKGFTYREASMVAVINIGARYAKLAVLEPRNGEWKPASSYAYLDLTNGDLLKGNWKAPINGAVRGNINDADILTKFDVYGPVYLRGQSMESISTILAGNLGK